MIEYEEDWLCPILVRLNPAIQFRAGLFALFASALTFFLILSDSLSWSEQLRPLLELGSSRTQDGDGLVFSQIWRATTTVMIFLIAFRTRQGLARFWEGTGLLHQMRGEWFDTVSNCITFSIKTRKTRPEEVNKFRHTIVRLMSLCHGSALEEISENSALMETIDSFGLDARTLTHLKECSEHHGFNKVEVLLHLLQSCITEAHQNAILDIPPPILSRVYQTISRGFVNLLNTKKITDTKFPFPFVQLMTWLLLSHLLMTPIYIAARVTSLVMGPLITFVPIYGMFSLNFIAMELENPFGTDDNDLPLAEFQDEMNNCLLMLLHDNTDLVASVGPTCVLAFDDLKYNVKTRRASEFDHAERDLDLEEKEREEKEREDDCSALPYFRLSLDNIFGKRSVTSSQSSQGSSKSESEQVGQLKTFSGRSDRSSASEQLTQPSSSLSLARSRSLKSAVMMPASMIPMESSGKPARATAAPSLIKNIQELNTNLEAWTQQMGDLAQALNNINVDMPRLLDLKQPQSETDSIGSGWQAAVCPL